MLGKHQLNELGSESAKIKAMGISSRVLLYSISLKSILKNSQTDLVNFFVKFWAMEARALFQWLVNVK